MEVSSGEIGNELSTVATPFLDCFWSMASTESKDRSFAAASLATHVSLESNQETKESNHVYAIKRLIRGICSSRGGARQGFSTGLTMVLSAAAKEHALSNEDNIDENQLKKKKKQKNSEGTISVSSSFVNEVIDRLMEETTPTGGMRGSEERDLFVGRLFGLASCARRSFLCPENKENDETNNDKYDENSSQVAIRILNLLIELYRKRKWMREACVASMNDLLNNSTSSLKCNHLLPAIAPLLQDDDIQSYNAEEVALGLIVQNNLNDIVVSYDDEEKIKICIKFFPSILYPDNLDNLDSDDDDDDDDENEMNVNDQENKNKIKYLLHPSNVSKLSEPMKLATQTFPHVHLLWQLIIDELFNKEDDESNDKLSQIDACWQVVEGALLVGSSHTMKGTILTLLPLFAEKLNHTNVKVIFTPKVLRLIMNSTSKKENILFGQAKQALSTISELNGKNSPWRFQVACCFMDAQTDQSTNNAFNFDSRTGTKTVSTLLSQLDDTSRETYFNMLENAIFQPSSEATNSHQLSAISSLYTAVRSPLVSSQETTHEEKANSTRDSWAKRVLSLLMGIAFFDLSPLCSLATINETSSNVPKSAKKQRKGRSASIDETSSMEKSNNNGSPREYIEKIQIAIQKNNKSSDGTISNISFEENIRKLASSRFFSLLADQCSSGGVNVMIEWLGYIHEIWCYYEDNLKCNLFSTLSKQVTDELENLRKLCGPLPSSSSSKSSSLKSSSKKKRKNSMDENDGNDTSVMKSSPMELILRKNASSSSSSSSSLKGNNDQIEIKRTQAFLVLLRSSSLLLLKYSENGMNEQKEVNNEEDEDDEEESVNDVRNDVVTLLATLRECYSTMTSQSKDDEEDDVDDQSMAILAASSLSLLDIVSGDKDSMAVRGIRECIKRSFGLVLTCESELDAMTLNTIVSAVCGDEINNDDDEEEDLTDEEEDDDEAAMIESEEDDNDEDDDDGRSDNDKIEDALTKIRNLSSNQHSNGGDNDDVILSNRADLAAVLLNDDESEEQTRLRQQALENMLAARRLAKPTKAMRKEDLRYKCQRRLRALDLLEQVAKIHHSSPHLLAAILPLINAVRELQEEGASSDAVAVRSSTLPSEAKDLKQRLSNFLKNKLFKKCHVKPYTNSTHDELLSMKISAEYTLNGLFSIVKMKCGSGDIRNTMSDLCLNGLSICLHALKLSNPEADLLEILPSLFLKKNDHTNKNAKNNNDNDDEEEEEKEEEDSVAVNLQIMFHQYMNHKTQKSALDKIGINYFIEIFKSHKTLFFSAILPDLSTYIYKAKSPYLKTEALKLFLFLFSNKEMRLLNVSISEILQKKNSMNKQKKNKKEEEEEDDDDDEFKANLMIIERMELTALTMLKDTSNWLEEHTKENEDIEKTLFSKQQQKFLRPLLESTLAVFSWYQGDLMTKMKTQDETMFSKMSKSLSIIANHSMGQAIQQFCRKLITCIEGASSTSSNELMNKKRSKKNTPEENDEEEDDDVFEKKEDFVATPSKKKKKTNNDLPSSSSGKSKKDKKRK